MAHHKHNYVRRHHNPFTPGGIAPLATKVAGGLAGGIGAAVIPNMLGSSMGSGWAGVIAALVIAFGGAYLTKNMSANFSEGILIGGTLQAAGRVAQLTIGKNIVSFSLSGYAPLTFPIPYPGYQVGGGAPAALPARVPASSAVTTMPKAGMSGVRSRGMRAVA